RAYMHQYGIGGSANFPEAIRLYDLAIAKGNSVAMLRRAYMYQKAIGGPENLPEAIRLYDLAITKGNSAAMQKRAYMHQRGIGGPVNLEKAIRLYDLAVTKGLPIAMINRAYMHEKAIGGPENLLEAIRLYDLAINKGHSYAMVHRAQMYENGIGGEKNIPKAIDLWIHALTSDNEAWSKTYGHNALDNLIRITTCYPHPPIKAKIAIFIIFMQGICGIPMDKHRAGLYHKDSIEFIEALLDIYILQLIGIPTYFPTIVDATISFLKASIHPNSLPLFKFKEIEARQALLAENGEKALESLLSLPLEYFSNSEHLLHFIMLILNCVGPDQKSIILPHLDRGIRCFPESKDLDKLHRFLLLEIEGKIQELSDESKENKTQRYAKALARETSFIDMKIKSAIIAFESYIESSIIKLCGLCSSIWHHKDIHLAQMILVSLRAGQSPYIVYSNHRQELKEFPVLNNLLINHCYYTPTIIEKPTAAKPNLLAQNVFANADATASTGLNTATSLSPA
ncbi:MAG: hypothetical protein K0R66_1240, partial [Gammaproteobacteria bacterium]|nr:hypothetical protein [Gammaproteobacteria bacterium]